MSEKEYVVVVNKGVNLEEFDAELSASSGSGPIPNRSVEIANPRIGSKRMTHWMLTDEEASALQDDSRVFCVERPVDQRDDIQIGYAARQTGTFYRGSNLDPSYVNWGLRRCTAIDNSAFGFSTTLTGDYDYAIDGTGVDVVIQDSGIQADHPEWISTKDELIDTVQGGTATFNFIDNNIATNDIYVPYYQFANPTANYFASMTGTPWANGQYDGAEFLIRFVLADGKTVERTRIFGGIGNGTVTAGKNTFELSLAGTIHIEQTSEDLRLSFTSGGYTQNGVIQLWLKAGQTRMRQIDWYGASGLSGTQNANHYRDNDGHGTHVAGIAAGKTYGWAKGAHVYSQKLAGLETLAGTDGTGIALADSFDSIRLWHNNKPVDPVTGAKRPTVVNMSWAYSSVVTATPTNGTYRGSPWTWGSTYTDRYVLWADTGVPIDTEPGGGVRMPVRVGSVDVEIDDLIDAGIHVCIAAGNTPIKHDVSNGLDYNNVVVFSGVSYEYHRGTSPYSDRAFNVGSIDQSVQSTGGAFFDKTSTSSARGPAVNMWAPGFGIISAASNTGDASYTTIGYPVDTEYNNGEIIAVVGDGSDFFKREVTVNGVRIMGAGAVGGQTAVPDAWLEKVARMFELFTDPYAAGINGSAQRALIKNLSGDTGTYHAGLPTIQRVARGAGSDYSTNFLTDAGITFWNLTDLFDNTVQNDMVWYLNSTGDGYGDGDTDAQEVIEHVFHTLHMHGLDAQSLKMYPFISADWATGPLYNAMVEAYDAGMWDPSGYEPSPGAFKTSGDAFEVAAKEYLYLLNFCMFEYTSLWEGGSLSPEWSDSMRTQAGILANNPLGYALHNSYIAPVISKPSLATIRSIFGDGNTPAQDDPSLAGTSGYVVDNYKIMNIGGTSMASPQVAGVVALKAGSAPIKSPDKIRGEVINESKNVVYNTGSSVDYENQNQSLLGSAPNILFSKYAVYNPMSYTGPLTIRNVGPRLR